MIMPLLFALTLFTSAALLFLVQPMVGRMLLPALGGSPAVWNTCLVFFQAVLLLGYLYAHISTRAASAFVGSPPSICCSWRCLFWFCPSRSMPRACRMPMHRRGGCSGHFSSWSACRFLSCRRADRSCKSGSPQPAIHRQAIPITSTPPVTWEACWRWSPTRPSSNRGWP